MRPSQIVILVALILGGAVAFKLRFEPKVQDDLQSVATSATARQFKESSPPLHESGGGRDSPPPQSSPPPVVLPPVPDDFGRAVQLAIDGGTPQQAKEALDYLVACEHVGTLREALERQKGGSKIENGKLGPLIAGVETTQRRCQTVTPEMQGYALELSKKALLGGVPDSAVRYGQQVNFNPPLEMRETLMRGLINDANAGSASAMGSLAVYGRELGLGKIETRAYLEALKVIAPKEPHELINFTVANRDFMRLSEDELSQAKIIASNLIESRKRSGGHS